MLKSIKINLQRFNKQFNIKNDVQRTFLERMLVAEYVRVYGDQYFDVPQAVGIEVIVGEKLRHTTERKNVIGQSSVNKVALVPILLSILGTLENVAYDRMSQVTEINIQKVFSSSYGIEIEVYGIEK